MHKVKDNKPILLTSRDRELAVNQDLDDFESMQEERNFMKAVTQGLLEIKESKEQSLEDVKAKLT